MKTKFDEEDRDEMCDYFKEFSHTDAGKIHAETLLSIATHQQVKRDKERFYKSFKKCDVLPKFPEGEVCGLDKKLLWQTAFEYTQRQVYYLKGSRVAHELEFNGATSPSLPYTKLGFPTKASVLESDIFDEDFKAKYDAIYTVKDKGNEYLSKEDINELKLRTFFSPDVVFLAWQKVFTTEQNDRMSEQWFKFNEGWSRYGMIKQYGGFSRLMKAHGKFTLHATGDGSGWDRVISLFRAWLIRHEMLDMTEQAREHFFSVFLYSVFPYVGLPSGDVYRRFTGNCSGANTTTTDNILAHIELKYYHILLLGAYTHGRVLTYDEIMSNTLISIYGDDFFDSYNKEFFFPENDSEQELKETILRIMGEAYGDYGVGIKSTQAHFRMGTPEGLEFLGSTAVESKGTYYPASRLGKLCTSITHKLEKVKTVAQVADSIRALYELVAIVPNSENRKVAEALVGFAGFMYGHKDRSILTPETQNTLYKISQGETRWVRSLVTGYEGQPCLGFKKNVDKTTIHGKACESVC